MQNQTLPCKIKHYHAEIKKHHAEIKHYNAEIGHHHTEINHRHEEKKTPQCKDKSITATLMKILIRGGQKNRKLDFQLAPYFFPFS